MVLLLMITLWNTKTVKYTNISNAIDILKRMPKGSYSAKSDIQDAFKIIPVQPIDQAKLGFNFNDNYYFDRTLPQGCSSSCYTFELFSTALNHIVKFHIPGCEIIHYLDDFLIIAMHRISMCHLLRHFHSSL